MTCDECGKLFVIDGKIIHLPDTDGVINVKLETQEPIGYHEFVGGIGQLYRELIEKFKGDE